MLYFFIYCLFVVIRLLELTRGRLKSPGETSRPKDTPSECSLFAARLEWILLSLTVGECPSPISRLHLNALGGSLHIFRGRASFCRSWGYMPLRLSLPDNLRPRSAGFVLLPQRAALPYNAFAVSCPRKAGLPPCVATSCQCKETRESWRISSCGFRQII